MQAYCTKNLIAETRNKILLLKNLDAAFVKDNIHQIIRTSTQRYRLIFTTAQHFIAWKVLQRLNGRISRLRAITMRSNDRAVPGYQRINTIFEAICIDQDAEKTKQAVAEAAAVAKTILDK